MSRSVFVCAIVAVVATVASGQVLIRGILQGADRPITVDSTMFVSASGNSQWFTTSGWQVQPEQVDSFNFPQFEEWPQLIMISGSSMGDPLDFPIPDVVPDSWYVFNPPLQPARVKFTLLTGVEQGPGHATLDVAIAPSVVNGRGVVRLSAAGCPRARAEVTDESGRHVRALDLSPSADGRLAVAWCADDDAGRPVPEGVYICRLVAPVGTAARKVILTR